jgi:cellulose biosynthesis protein BcsQ
MAQSSLGSSAARGRLLNEFYKINIRIVGFLPTQVNARLSITATVSATLEAMAKKTAICILPTIRVDRTVHEAGGAQKLLFDYDPTSKVAEDYEATFAVITARFEADRNGQAQKA